MWLIGQCFPHGAGAQDDGQQFGFWKWRRTVLEESLPGPVIRLDILYPVVVSRHVVSRENFLIYMVYNFSKWNLEMISTHSNPNTDRNGQTNN